MFRTGFADLRLCDGYVPMYKEMVKLSKPIIELLLDEYGESEVIKRFSDPFWFQSLATAMGFEYNYTGATTVTIKAIKEAINREEFPIKIAGGKGKLAINTPNELEVISEQLNLNERTLNTLKEASKISAKVDNSLVQDSFNIYFHSIIINSKGEYTIINQGMNVKEKLVRRYHWYNPKDLIEEPHFSKTPTIKLTLNLTSRTSRDTRETILDIVRDQSIEWIKRKAIFLSKKLNSVETSNLTTFLGLKSYDLKILKLPYYLRFPKRLNETALRIAREADSFKDLLLVKGMGPSTLRALAFISALIYSTELSWENPQLFCYAHGTKAGKPWYVEKKLMLENARLLSEIVEEAKLGKKDKVKVLKRLARIIERYS